MQKKTPLHQQHEEAGASFTDFAGFDMPVRYTSDLQEHHAVRNGAGLFDLSHMAEIDIAGPDAAEFLDVALSNRLSTIAVGQAKYSLVLNDDGGIIDDLIVYRLAPDRFWIVANAANRSSAVAALTVRATGFDVLVSDISDDWALIAVQGPHSLALVVNTPSIVPAVPLGELRYYRISAAAIGDSKSYIARTGYTGEDGYEIFVPVAHAVALWQELVSVGAPHQLTLCGLACRDTLRLEAGMPLYGHELSLATTPHQAGLARVVDATKEDFVGKSALLDQPDAKSRVLVGLVAEGRRAPRADYPVMSGETVVGVVTSGALSPTLGYPVAMAYVDPEFATPGTQIAVDVRGANLPVTVTTLPFYTRKKETP